MNETISTLEVRKRTDALLAKLQECETEAHAIGFHITAHVINKAKNNAGWELARLLADNGRKLDAMIEKLRKGPRP